MKGTLLFILTLFFFASCSRSNEFPVKKSESIETKKIPAPSNVSYGELAELYDFVNQYNSNNVLFSLTTFENQWELLAKNKKPSDANNIETWIAVSTLLLELTQNERYAAELERVAQISNSASDLVSPYVYTKNMDHIFVNLFQTKELNYTHSLGGEVSIRQETSYPKSGSVKLNFGMTERRYIELYIRIPVWAEGTTVTVKQVKYFAAPGSYCKIAKKWKEGDLVEIEFPIEKRLKKNNVEI